MKSPISFLLLPLVSSVLAARPIQPGTLFISRLSNMPVHKNLKFDGRRVAVTEEVPLFEYTNRGALKLLIADSYLCINKCGKFVSCGRPHAGFLLVTEPGLRFTSTLSYRGVEKFELCGDSSIRYMSGCPGAQPISITYEDRMSPRRRW